MTLAGPPAIARDPEWMAVPQDKARIVALKFAKCVVQARRTALLAALDMPVGDKTTGQRLTDLSDSGCFIAAQENPFPTQPSVMTQSQLVLRGYFYQALLMHDFHSTAHAPPISSLAVAYPVATRDQVDTTARDYRALMRIAECAVRRDSMTASALVYSPIASKGEVNARAAFDTVWSTCLPAGFTAPFSTDVVRGSVAELLYRLSSPAIPAVAGNK